MPRETLTITEAFFPDDRRFEYYLQRLRIVLVCKVKALKVVAIRDVPDSLDPKEFPSLEVVIRIPGLKLQNPATGQPLMSSDWLRQHFEAWPTQEAYWLALRDYIVSSIPPTHPEAALREKFKEIKSGAPGNLPARADLFVSYQQLDRQLNAAKKWLAARRRPGQMGFSDDDQTAFVNSAKEAGFWWIKYVVENEVSLEQIAQDTPKCTAKEILALKYEVSPESIRDRLVRREK